MPALDPGFRWERLTEPEPGERRDILLLCPAAEDCAGGLSLLRRLGLRPEPVAEARLDIPGAARLWVERHRLAFPGPEEAPSAEQAAHVLAAALGAPPRLEHFACTEAGARRLCRALLRREDGGRETRRLQFERLGRLALPQGVGPAESALAALDPGGAQILCRLESRRAGFWFDRPGLARDPAEAAAAFAAMLRAQAEQDPVTCLKAAAALSNALDLDWRPGRLPQPATGCAVELSSGRALAGALEGGLADPAVAFELRAAEAAAQRNDQPNCLIGAARVRAAWLARFGLATAGASLDSAGRLAVALGESAALAICRSEAARAAFWYDRPEAVAHPMDAVPALQAWMRAQSEGEARRCLEAGFALARVFDLDWRPGHLPRPPMGCEQELRWARVLAGALAGGLADARVAAELAEAEAAARRGDQPGCLIGAARLRAAWFARFGLESPPR